MLKKCRLYFWWSVVSFHHSHLLGHPQERFGVRAKLLGCRCVGLSFELFNITIDQIEVVFFIHDVRNGQIEDE